jgi:hypothetical protein
MLLYDVDVLQFGVGTEAGAGLGEFETPYCVNCARAVPAPARLCPVCGARLTKRLFSHRGSLDVIRKSRLYPALRNGFVITVVVSTAIAALTGGFRGGIEYAGSDVVSFAAIFGEVAVFMLGASVLLHLLWALDIYFKS